VVCVGSPCEIVLCSTTGWLGGVGSQFSRLLSAMGPAEPVRVTPFLSH
jgi:hypothetical protein